MDEKEQPFVARCSTSKDPPLHLRGSCGTSVFAIVVHDVSQSRVAKVLKHCRRHFTGSELVFEGR